MFKETLPKLKIPEDTIIRIRPMMGDKKKLNSFSFLGKKSRLNPKPVKIKIPKIFIKIINISKFFIKSYLPKLMF